MSVIRQVNWLGQMRVDVPNMRAVESSIAHDFDVLLGKIVSGEESVVVKGLTIDVSTAAGNPATALSLTTAGALVMHFNATEAGTMLEVPSTQANDALNSSNPNVSGSFAASTLNYVGIDYLRSADTTTDDQVEFLSPSTNSEVPREVPTARILNYVIYISQTPFSLSTNICPIAIVQTDSSGNVTGVTDSRNLLGRLATGGDVPNLTNSFSWTSRLENPAYVPPGSLLDPFSGGDKGITSLKGWMDAVMSMIWEAKSGQYWYSQTKRDGLKVGMSGTAVFAANNDNFLWTWSGASGTLKWQGLSVLFENSPQYYNPIADNASVGVSLGVGQCLYVDINRNATESVINGGQLSRTSTTVTANTATAHGFTNGQTIYLTITDTNFPAGAKVITVVSSTQFTYTESGSATTSTNAGSVAAGLSAQVGTLETLTGASTPGARFILCWVAADGQLYIRDRPFDYNRLTNVLTTAGGYPTYFVKTEFQLQQAIAGMTTNNGGVVAIIAPLTITQSYVFPANVKVLGINGAATMTIAGNYSVSFGDKSKIEDMWFDASAATTGATINSGQLSRSGSTVTANTATPHGFSSNQYIYLASTDTNFVAGVKQITVTGASAFTYTEAGTATTSGSSTTCAQCAVVAAGKFFEGYDSVFKSNPTGSNVSLGIVGNYATCQDSEFYGCIVPSTGIGIAVNLGAVDTYLNNNTFLN